MLRATYAYLPADRLAALADGRELPLRASGAVLSVDVVGFTRITEAFAATLGARRGADALVDLLNQVYTMLISCVEDWGGNVVSFSGDALRCWFPDDDGRSAIACASQIQRASQALGSRSVPAESAVIAIKAAVVVGEVQRLSLGDPAIQLIDTLAGGLLSRLADLEALVQPGEIIVDEPVALSPAVPIAPGARRHHPDFATQGVVVAGIAAPLAPAVAPPAVAAALPELLVRPWLLPGVWDRLQRGMGDFLTELRPVVALFGQFGEIDVQDSEAVGLVNRYVGWVQGVISRYDGMVLQITLGEKGNYFYAAFGVFQAHEDDAVRAVCAAGDLQTPPADSPIGARLRVGIASGIMRTGVYGSPTRRTYGVLGDAANLAARLMQHAQPDTILVTQDMAVVTADQIDWVALEPITVKGKRDPLSVYRYIADRSSQSIGQPAHDQLPMIGRQAELEQLLGYLAGQPRQGQVIAINGEAGIGKSRLITEVAAAARRRGWLVYASECQSYLQNTPYSLWQPLLRQLMRIDEAAALTEQISSLERTLAGGDPHWLPRLPLLGPLLNLSIPDNELTRTFDAQLRNASREALVVGWLRGWVLAQAAATTGIVLIFEDVHWIDPLSLSLLAAITRVIAPLPVIMLLAHRPLDAAAALTAQLVGASSVPLDVLSPAATGELIAARLAHVGQSANPAALKRLVGQVYTRTQGNPFYVEELLAYLHGSGRDPRDPLVWERSELPTSLHQLLLSRIDQLTPTQQETLKMASVIGRLFRAAWLEAYDQAPSAPHLHDEALGNLRAAELILLESVEPELTYLFRHVIAQEVAYESLGFATRARLHEQLAAYLERGAPALDDQRIYLIAYHYERSANQAKRREYLLLAGRAAQAAYANADAIRYYEAALLLTDQLREQEQIDADEVAGLIEAIGDIQTLVSASEQARSRYQAALDGGADLEAAARARLQRKIGATYEQQADWTNALTWLAAAQATVAAADATPTIQGEYAQIVSTIGWIHFRQRDLPTAQTYLHHALDVIKPLGKDAEEAQILNRLGGVVWTQDDLTQAHQYVLQSLGASQRSDDIIGQARALNNLSILNSIQDNMSESITYALHALDIQERIGSIRDCMMSYINLGSSLYYGGQYAESAAYLKQGVEKSSQINDPYLQMKVLRNYGRTLAELGQYDEGRTYLEQGLALCQKLNLDQEQLEVHIDLAELELAQNQLERAETEYRCADAIQKRPASEEVAKLQRLEGRIRLAQNDRQAAHRLLIASEETFRKINQRTEARITRALIDTI
jgi:adenylate cyclase